MRTASTLAACIVVSIITTPLFAQAPDSVSFQGYVTDSGDNPINNAGLSMTFKLYDGSTEIWSETQPSVPVANGLFNVLLGSVTPLDTVRFNRPLNMGITVGGDPEIIPRTPLTAAAYAKAMPGMYTYYRESGSWRSYNVVGGAMDNVVEAGAVGATISGGGGHFSTVSYPNSATANFATVSGGMNNSAQGEFSTVAGGTANSSEASATVSGGHTNSALGAQSTVSGGRDNTASATNSTVSGGIGNTAAGFGATVSGGSTNNAQGDNSVIGGGSSGKASGQYSTVPGGLLNWAGGSFSFAAGRQARAKHNGSFVWSDQTTGDDSLVTTGPNQFLIGAAGGVGIGTDSPRSDAQLDVNGAIHVRSATLLFHGTSASGLAGQDDGARIRYFGDYDGDGDHLIFEKTDANQNNPDGGIAFVNTGADGIVEKALQIHGSGSVEIPGNLTKGSGSFKIDHPLDPTNKYLYHSFVESPDMKNVYDGVVTLDADGEAEVRLPAYFEALNRDFRYQLTPIGASAPNLYISNELDGNTFGISGGNPGMKVSWMVTGIRKDPFAAHNPIEVEVDKSPNERGTYLHPEAYGVSR